MKRASAIIAFVIAGTASLGACDVPMPPERGGAYRNPDWTVPPGYVVAQPMPLQSSQGLPSSYGSQPNAYHTPLPPMTIAPARAQGEVAFGFPTSAFEIPGTEYTLLAPVDAVGDITGFYLNEPVPELAGGVEPAEMPTEIAQAQPQEQPQEVIPQPAGEPLAAVPPPTTSAPNQQTITVAPEYFRDPAYIPYADPAYAYTPAPVVPQQIYIQPAPQVIVETVYSPYYSPYYYPDPFFFFGLSWYGYHHHHDHHDHDDHHDGYGHNDRDRGRGRPSVIVARPNGQQPPALGGRGGRPGRGTPLAGNPPLANSPNVNASVSPQNRPNGPTIIPSPRGGLPVIRQQAIAGGNGARVGQGRGNRAAPAASSVVVTPAPGITTPPVASRPPTPQIIPTPALQAVRPTPRRQEETVVVRQQTPNTPSKLPVIRRQAETPPPAPARAAAQSAAPLPTPAPIPTPAAVRAAPTPRATPAPIATPRQVNIPAPRPAPQAVRSAPPPAPMRAAPAPVVRTPEPRAIAAPAPRPAPAPSVTVAPQRGNGGGKMPVLRRNNKD